MKRILVLVVALTVLGQTSAAGWFNSECDQRIKSYKSYISKYNAQSKSEKVANEKISKENDRQLQDCLVNPSTYKSRYPRAFRENKIDVACFFAVTLNIEFVESKSVQSYKNAMQVVINFKQCFKTEEFIKAKNWLRNNS